MIAKARALLAEESTVTLAIIAILFGIFTLALETAFHLPVRLPGHRAFPGALALLMFAQAFAPAVLLGFAAIVSSILVIGGHATWLALGVWVLTGLGLWALKNTKIGRTFVFFIVGGLLFGLLRYLSVSQGFHHTPEIIRISGHLGFGLLGGMTSLGVSRLFGTKFQEENYEG